VIAWAAIEEGMGMKRGIVAAATAAFLFAGAASAELAKWDQTRVTAYAEELAVATDDLRQSLEAIGIQNATQANAYYQVRDTVKSLDTAAEGLAASLKSGEGHDKTLPRYKRLQTLRRDAAEEGQRADIPESVFEKVFSVGSALMKLRPYYEEEEKAAQ
jgi:hypothetical protein